MYLDNAATTKIDPEVLDAMMPYLTEKFYNPGALYDGGKECKEAIEKARKQVADLINADPNQIIFTSGGTECNNFVKGGGLFYCTITEHDSAFRGCNGSFSDTSGLAELLQQDYISRNQANVVIIQARNNEIGCTYPLDDMIQVCHSFNVPVHIDAVQEVPLHHVDVKELDCDSLSFSSHKMHGPKGVGALYLRNKDAYIPLIKGGKDQEFGLRGGTENVAGIVGFGKACELVQKNRETRLYNANRNRIIFRVEFEKNMKRLGHKFHFLGNFKGHIQSIYIPNIDANTLVYFVRKDLQISAGSACHSHSNEPSRTLLAYGFTEEQARQTIRVSFSGDKDETSEEVCVAAKKLAEKVDELFKLNDLTKEEEV